MLRYLFSIVNDLGFSFQFKDGILIIYRDGMLIKKIKGHNAYKFIERTRILTEAELQIEMARITGDYKRGNERKARKHQRN